MIHCLPHDDHYTLTDEVVFEMLGMKRCIVIGVIVNSVASEMVVKAKCRAVIGGNDKVDSGAGEIVLWSGFQGLQFQ